MSSKRNAASFEGYSSEAKVRKVVAQGEKDQSYSSQSDSEHSKDEEDDEEQSAGGDEMRMRMKSKRLSHKQETSLNALFVVVQKYFSSHDIWETSTDGK